MISSILTIVQAILIGGIASTFIMLGIVVIDAIISVVYSYKAYNKYSNM